MIAFAKCRALTLSESVRISISMNREVRVVPINSRRAIRLRYYHDPYILHRYVRVGKQLQAVRLFVGCYYTSTPSLLRFLDRTYSRKIQCFIRG
jgi:hypothetical protein